MPPVAPSVVALAGGVGAARLLRGLAAAIEPGTSSTSNVTAVVNTGDDIVLHGLYISPDLDTVTYTLGGGNDDQRGWGLRGETWAAMAAMERYAGCPPAGSTAGGTWFRLGDRDLATHLYRTHRLSEGAGLAAVTGEIAAAWELRIGVLPMSDQRVETRVTVAGPAGRPPVEIGFQEYFVGRRHDVAVRAVRFAGIEAARPAPGVLEALESADRIVVCPSNPIVSIGPVLAVPGIGHAVAARREDAVAVSPIVAGAALRGPADRMLRELGHDPSVVGVARLYAPYVSTLLVDSADAPSAAAVEAEGVRCIVTPTVMHGLPEATALARVLLG